LLLTANLYTLGGIQGINLASNTTKKLDTIADLGFTTEYLFSEKFSAFLQLKNIFAKEYERYLNYPSRGFMLLGGVTLSF
jgi:outer membrane cobalamin receptor